METILQRIDKIAQNEGIKITALEKHIGASKGVLSRAINNGTDIQTKWIQSIVENYPLYSESWLLTGRGEMRKSDRGEKTDIKFYDPENKPVERKLIPFYEDIATVGGVNAVSADVNSTPGVSEWIDAGDWFRDATAAIRHYGDSMMEYPSGCILALKKVEDIRLLLWGKNYCIETTEYRITKQLQPGEDKNTLLAYSSNRETYHDGRLIHAPVPIPLDSIRSIFLVLGCVIKEYSSGAVYIKK